MTLDHGLPRSLRTKIVLYSGVGLGGDTDTASGNESTSMWMSVPNSLFSFKWFVNTTNVASLSSTLFSSNVRLYAPNITLGSSDLQSLLDQKPNGVNPVLTGTGSAVNLNVTGTLNSSGAFNSS